MIIFRILAEYAAVAIVALIVIVLGTMSARNNPPNQYGDDPDKDSFTFPVDEL